MEDRMEKDLDTAKALALQAGEILLRHYANPQVAWKGPRNPVTVADREASTFLVRELKKLFPNDAIVSEEEPDDGSRRGKSRVWIIDPLDGTMEYIEHRDEFCVMIGLSSDGVSVVGVVYQPVTQKLYYGAANVGAFIAENGSDRSLHVSPESNPSAMTITVSRSHPLGDVEAVRRELGITKALPYGSLGLKIGLICEGRAHLYLNTSRHTSVWDVCAPEVILREAGGRLTDLLNAPLVYDGDLQNLQGVVASNGVTHERIIHVVQSVLRQRA